MQRAMIALVLASMSLLAGPAAATELKPKTVEAFDRYVQRTEERMAAETRDAAAFLWMDRLPEPKRQNVYAQLRQGHIFIEEMETREGEQRVKIPDGLVHHWIAANFIPGVTLQQTLALAKDYDRHQDIYKPDVVRSRLLRADGNDFKVYLRLHRKAIVTAVFNAEFDVRYFPVDAARVHSRSYSTRIAEVQNPDRPEEHEKPVGKDRGFLWRLYSYWRFEEKDGGVYVQIESIALSRGVPAVLAWLINPLLKSVPREYLSNLLNSTRAALQNKSAAPARSG